MPVVQSKLPKNLRPYLFHGVDLSWKEEDEQAMGECIFCGGSRFSVELSTSKHQCWNCKSVGNATKFLQKLWAASDEATQDYSVLQEHRKLEHPDTLMAWGVCRSISTNDWLVPGYSSEGKLNQLYRYMGGEDRSVLIPTPTLGHKLFGVSLYKKKKPRVFLCEGPWDAIALWELLGQAKEVKGVLQSTANRGQSILADANVLAVPGCTTFVDSWCSLFAGKLVYLMYDNDHPRKDQVKAGTPLPAGLGGMKRVAQMLLTSPKPPREINYLAWGENGYDLSLPSGYDIRDAINA